MPPAWKQNMLVLLVLYPLVFLFGELVQEPLLLDNGVEFWLALFHRQRRERRAVFGWVLIPWISGAFGRWLSPPSERSARVSLVGAALVALLYGLLLAVFSIYP